jgi:hypothetical protein
MQHFPTVAVCSIVDSRIEIVVALLGRSVIEVSLERHERR